MNGYKDLMVPRVTGVVLIVHAKQMRGGKYAAEVAMLVADGDHPEPINLNTVYTSEVGLWRTEGYATPVKARAAALRRREEIARTECPHLTGIRDGILARRRQARERRLRGS